MIEKRSIAVCIILSIMTCGIYGLVWLCWLNDDTNTVSNEPNPTSGGMVILRSIVTCGIYSFYWAYKQGEKLDRANRMHGLPQTDSGIVYLLLVIFGLGIVAYALMQDKLNEFAENPAGGASAHQTYVQTDAYQAPEQSEETVHIENPTVYPSQDTKQ